MTPTTLTRTLPANEPAGYGPEASGLLPVRSDGQIPTMEVMAMLRKGARFIHKHWLDPTTMGPNPQGQLFQITQIRQGQVYFRPVYRYESEGGREVLGQAFYRPVETFEAQDVAMWEGESL
jgi:hypothetical protein